MQNTKLKGANGIFGAIDTNGKYTAIYWVKASLTSFTINSELTNMGYTVFQHCENLTAVSGSSSKFNRNVNNQIITEK
jgi:hypothetical protein